MAYRSGKPTKDAYNRLYYDRHSEVLKAKRRARYRAKVLATASDVGLTDTRMP